MPVWHEQTLRARRTGQLVVLGVIQEQHADRCRLFAQWQGFDWPILHDPVNRLGPRAVPIFVAIDEAGVVVDANLTNAELDDFLSRPSAEASSQHAVPVAQDADSLEQQAQRSGAAKDWMTAGDHRLLWGDTGKESAAIDCYAKCVEADPSNAAGWFRLGVAYRARYDSPQSRSGDFASAAAAWDRALELDPNHYIYRRRIQQYGPRLSKPYPFYDWIKQARSEIVARGQTPVSLASEPVGAEIAEPSQDVRATQPSSQPPDPQDRITRDVEPFIQVNVVVVPGKIKPGEAVRVHLKLQPSRDAHWNNEAEPPRIWLKLPDGWEAESQLIELAQPSEPESREARTVDFELRAANDSTDQTVDAYALYYVCEEEGGQCLYRRQDLQIAVRFEN